MIYLGADHRGYNLKEKIRQWLTEWNQEFEDLGNDHLDPEDDYPDFAKKVAEKLSWSGPPATQASLLALRARGIVICGSGVGVDIVANRRVGVRCGLGFSAEQVKKAREDDDINCLAIPADYLPEEKVKEIVRIFLETKFSGAERMKRRIEKIDK